MSPVRPGPSGRVVSFLDIGTNSVRLLVVRLNPNHSYTILSRQKQQVRLGEGEFEEEEITPEAMDRAVMVCRKLGDLARSFDTEEFVAVATSALREASNQNTLLHLLRMEAHLDVRVISGREEARLIYLGVADAAPPGDRNALFIDIGGGSTEVAIGSAQEYQYLESFRLGAIRLSNLYLPRDFSGPVTPEQYGKIQEHIRNAIVHSLPEIRRHNPALALGSSGTVMNLYEIARKASQKSTRADNPVLTYRDLKKVVGILCSLPLEERRNVPGINPERADIIVAGAAILDTFMEELSLDSVTITGRGLQDGLLADYLSRMDEFPLLGRLSPRQRSVIQLGRSCGINEVHARTVTGLVLGLFDSARELGLHALGDRERELLEYATFLHDVGSFISYTNHHAHSYYIIRNSELLGFDQREVTFMANLARFHRKKAPRKKDPEVSDLDPKERESLKILSTFLRLGESLDRSHAALIRHVRFSRMDENSVSLGIITRGDCHLEIWGIEGEKKAFEKVFGRKLSFDLLDVGLSGDEHDIDRKGEADQPLPPTLNGNKK
ncbi:MAG TPA: Ppx/GppA phosphatase family protein [Methanoregula sp.]|nr:Ppx/GppA phosphatase family protein [Methanoregula sp.]